MVSNIRIRRHRAFTLIELLVVIAIIGVLAMLIMGSMGYVMQRSETVRCIDSMRQMGTALHAYRNDHDGWFPPGYPTGGSVYTIAPPDTIASGTMHAYLIGYITDLRYNAGGGSQHGELPFCPGGMGGAASRLDNEERTRRVRGSYGFNSLFSAAKFDHFPYNAYDVGDGVKRNVGPSRDIFDPSRYPFLLEIRADGGNLNTWSFTHQNQALNGSFGETGGGWGAISPGRSHGYGDALNFMMMAGNVETIPRNDFSDSGPMDKRWEVPANPRAMFHSSGRIPDGVANRTAGQNIYFSHGQVSAGQYKAMYPQFSSFEEP